MKPPQVSLAETNKLLSYSLLQEELGILPEQLTKNVVQYREDLYHRITENKISDSYPGLPCVYRMHYVRFDITSINRKKGFFVLINVQK